MRARPRSARGVTVGVAVAVESGVSGTVLESFNPLGLGGVLGVAGDSSMRACGLWLYFALLESAGRRSDEVARDASLSHT